MALLLDTHTFIWYLAGHPRLSQTALAAIDAKPSECCVSIASVWEMGIAKSLGRIEFGQPFADVVEAGLAGNGFSTLNVELEHVAKLLELPFHHRDPFDRMLAAQCLVTGHSLVNLDKAFDEYGVTRIW